MILWLIFGCDTELISKVKRKNKKKKMTKLIGFTSKLFEKNISL